MATWQELQKQRDETAAKIPGFFGADKRNQLLAPIDAQIAAAKAEDRNRANVLDPIKRRLEGMTGPQKLTAEAAPVRSTAPLAQYERQRQQLQAQYSQGMSGQNQAIQRRFAAMGALNSGSAIKQMQLAQQRADEQRNDQAQAINAQEGQAQEAQYNQDRNAVAQRNFQRELTNMDSDFKSQLAGFDNASKLAQLDLAYRQFFQGQDNDAQALELHREQMRNQGGGFFDALGGLVGAGAGMFSGGVGTNFANKIFNK